MSSVRLSLVALAFLAACDGNPFAQDAEIAPDEVGGEAAAEVPDEVARQLNRFAYSDGVLRIDLQGATASGELATFVRAAQMDVASTNGNPAYEAYVYQDSALTRSILAYVAKNQRGNVMAVIASDGGQFNEHNDGGRYLQLSDYAAPATTDAPESGLYSYIGTYAGVFSPGSATPNSAGLPPEFRPAEPWYTTGLVQINGDFARATVEGGVVQRNLFLPDGTQVNSISIGDGDPNTPDQTYDTTTLKSLVLRETAIEDDGSFLGKVETAGQPGDVLGDYGGAFGGVGALDVAGVLWLNPIKGESGIWEVGAFNLPRCDQANAAPLCVQR